MVNRVLAVSVPANAENLSAIRAFFDAALRPRFGAETDRLVLALDEACSNVVRHRSPAVACSTLDVEAEFLDAAVRFRIGSFCSREDLARIKPRDLADVRPGGLGTHFIERIMDRISYEEEPGRPGCLALVLEKAIPPPSDAARGGEPG
jgi:anti-sigma regulatory factor (Ser/Thr protein kinase)